MHTTIIRQPHIALHQRPHLLLLLLLLLVARLLLLVDVPQRVPQPADPWVSMPVPAAYHAGVTYPLAGLKQVRTEQRGMGVL